MKWLQPASMKHYIVVVIVNNLVKEDEKKDHKTCCTVFSRLMKIEKILLVIVNNKQTIRLISLVSDFPLEDLVITRNLNFSNPIS